VKIEGRVLEILGIVCGEYYTYTRDSPRPKRGVPVAGGVFWFCSRIRSRFVHGMQALVDWSLFANCKLDHAVLLSRCNLSINSFSMVLESPETFSIFT